MFYQGDYDLMSMNV